MMRSDLIVLATVCVFGVLGPAFGSVMFGIWVAVATLDPKTATAGLLLLVPPFTIFPYWFGAPPALATGLAHALVSPLVRSRPPRLALAALTGAVTTLLWLPNVIPDTGRASELALTLSALGAVSAIICALLTDRLRARCTKAAPPGESQKMTL
jgi:hypothetical protein